MSLKLCHVTWLIFSKMHHQMVQRSLVPLSTAEHVASVKQWRNLISSKQNCLNGCHKAWWLFLKFFLLRTINVLCVCHAVNHLLILPTVHCILLFYCRLFCYSLRVHWCYIHLSSDFLVLIVFPCLIKGVILLATFMFMSHSTFTLSAIPTFPPAVDSFHFMIV